MPPAAFARRIDGRRRRQTTAQRQHAEPRPRRAAASDVRPSSMPLPLIASSTVTGSESCSRQASVKPRRSATSSREVDRERRPRCAGPTGHVLQRAVALDLADELGRGCVAASSAGPAASEVRANAPGSTSSMQRVPPSTPRGVWCPEFASPNFASIEISRSSGGPPPSSDRMLHRYGRTRRRSATRKSGRARADGAASSCLSRRSSLRLAATP